jgi:hypothetical protein
VTDLRAFAAALDWRERDAAELLRGFADRFGPDDDATLVIHSGARWQVEPAAEALGAAGPDMLLVDGGGAGALEPHLAAVLSTRTPEGELAELPWLEPGTLRSLYDLRLTAAHPRHHRFVCNICGSPGVTETRGWPRDTASCANCRSAARFRALAALVAEDLFGQPGTVPSLPCRPELIGVGMSDHPALAAALGRRMTYTNTFYHCEPRLDVCAPGEHAGRHDLVICSEVFEHVPPPLEQAFAGLHDLLKPGGLLVFSVPYRPAGETVEHFPELHDYEIVERDGGHVLRNTTRDGRVQERTDLVFHGGPGETLELRLFALPDVLARLAAAGLTDVRVRREPSFPHGVWWPGWDGWPITARRPG